ncbi:phosphoenolpyruvate carboxylase [candidate division MSBL1 archaeon SCGC-AAA382A03]|uniref:Phosphoenolpyruvate carboxylase n=1 Tax=candidate division MSBL1 archaeon SCGC-AAA382A03 TaxID=1698278 RepID=A0A133VH33_9EURY|nr:phosphoenolpyruvate carboxylase [candidate division MSBL1 archaeon SCGC-AAA382A03]
MSTQHPDNANQPKFVKNPETLRGKDEVYEAFHAYSRLGCDEQMWDIEGKEASRSVVRELLEENPDFFKENKLGKDFRLTARIPNPEYERVEQKVVLEILENIPRSYDAANVFYGDGTAPIYEVILPMTTSSESLERIYHYYKDYVSGKESHTPFDKTIGEWMGEIKPERVNVIPLIEKMEYMLKASDIVRDFLKKKDFKSQRVFLARSDPALNYGLIAAVLINKIALTRLQKLDEEISTNIYPIIGAGSAPFRGNLTPDHINETLEEYPSVQTFTIQSAFKYDYPKERSSKSIEKLKKTLKKPMIPVNEKRSLSLIEKTRNDYRKKISKLENIVNKIAQYSPSRRSRKLHIGLFGYSREVESGNGNIKLPRAITFTASLYSIGIPPEIIGFSALTDKDIEFLSENAYKKLLSDLQDAMQYYNENSLKKYPFLKEDVKKAKEYIDIKTNEEHKKITDQILKQKTDNIKDKIIKAAKIRKFLG